MQTRSMVKALDGRRLAGADVTNPLPKGHALWKFENVVITPHIAGQPDGVKARQMELFKEASHVVDKQKGY